MKDCLVERAHRSGDTAVGDDLGRRVFHVHRGLGVATLARAVAASEATTIGRRSVRYRGGFA
jgi:hypothetical protein